MMILPNKKDAVHKAWLYRVLEQIADDAHLSTNLYFKGGTCACMLGYLNRFSVDLDFDYCGATNETAINKTKQSLENIFQDLGLTIKDQSKVGLQYFLKYESTGRNTLKIDISYPIFTKSIYETCRFVEIDRIIKCQNKETMFAHKLVALKERFDKTQSIAGRDLYDIHHFFMQGYLYNTEVIYERTNLNTKEFLSNLVTFIEKELTDKIISEDLSSLLPLVEFNKIRKVLKREVITFIKDEINRL